MLTEILELISKTDFRETYSAKSTDSLLDDIRRYLIGKMVFIAISPIDSWHNWHYTIWMEDAGSPFFEPTNYDRLNDHPTYDDALAAGILTALRLMVK